MKQIKITYGMGMFNVDSEDEQISFSLIEGMYKTEDGIGYGCQVGDETKREDVEKMCFNLYQAIKNFQV